MISSQARGAVQTSAPKTYSRLTRGLAGVVIATFLTSCATDPFHQLALKQAKEGPVDEGVAKLKESSAKQPENKIYRVDYLRERERAVNQTLLDAARALGRNDLSEAEINYQRALGFEPDNAQAKLGLMEIDRIRRHGEAISAARDALERADYEAARMALQPVLIEDPQDAEAKEISRQIDAARYTGVSANQIPELGGVFKKPVSLQFRDANLKMIFEAISKTSGLNILMDKEVKSDLKATIFVKQASVEDTLNLLLMQNQLEKKVLNDSTIYIYPATPAKLKEYQDLVVRTFQLTNADAKAMQTLLKTVLKSKDLFVNEKTNSIVMRDTPEAVALAAKLLAAQDVNEPEVMLDMEVLEVSTTLATQLGISYPEQVAFGLDMKNIKALRNASAGDITISKLGVTLDLKKHDGDINTLANPRIRVRQREKAKIHIGERFPIITNTVTPSTGTPVVTGQIQYIDLGLKLEVEPDIHMDGEVGIKTSLEVSSLGEPVTGGGDPTNATKAYRVNTRTTNTVLRLKDGETQVLAGLIKNDETKASVKIPGLGDIPILGRLFSSRQHDTSKSELVLAITPHIIRNLHQPDADQATYWSGTDAMVKSRPVTVEKMETIKVESHGATSTTVPMGGAPMRPMAPTPASTPAQASPTSAAPKNSPPPNNDLAPGDEPPPANSTDNTDTTEPDKKIVDKLPTPTAVRAVAVPAANPAGVPRVVPRGPIVNSAPAGMSGATVTPSQ